MNGGSWRVIARSVTGASHVRSGRENQDALRVFPAEGPPLVVAVADGHGSAASFRSATGAHLAVTLAVELIGAGSEAIARLPRAIVDAWCAAVDAHRERAPFTPQELELVQKESGAAAVRRLEENPRLAYGTTLLAALVTADTVGYLQLGDGEILEVSERGEVTRPLPRDERLIANETLSLALPGAEREFRTKLRATDELPALILLCTDGYPNSFRDDAGFLKVGADLLDIVRADGWEQVERELAGWLDEASTKGSGDDVTLALLGKPAR